MQASAKEEEGGGGRDKCFVILCPAGGGHSCGAVARVPGRAGGYSAASVATGPGMTMEGEPW